MAELRVGRWSRFVETRIDTFASKTLGIVQLGAANRMTFALNPRSSTYIRSFIAR